ncbi:MAG: recombinase family protein [Fimbriimonas sp.]
MSAAPDPYYARISALGKEAMREKRARGETMHLAPLGWRNARDGEGRSVVEPDPAAYPLVMEAVRMREKGRSIREICRAMEAKGLRSKRGNRISPMAMWKALDVQKPAIAANAS